MLKHVAPLDPKASIPDPDRGGFLPPEGRAVLWTPYWAGLAAREEIAVSAVQEKAAAAPEPPTVAEPHDELSAEAHPGT